MIRRQLTAVLAVLVAVSFNIGTAQAKGQGIFEARMVDVNPGPNFEVPGSEGKIEREGEFKVEIAGIPAGTYRVCLFHDDTVSHFLGTVLVDQGGELKLEGNLTMDPTAPLVVPGAVLVNPDFRMFLGDVGDCTGAPEFRSGLRVGTSSGPPSQ
jgi:hypothetical protein